MEREHPTKHRRKYRPLDVKTWFEGFLRLIGWILVIILSVLTGGLFVVYEVYGQALGGPSLRAAGLSPPKAVPLLDLPQLKVLNRHDVDFRDMHFDQRITNGVNKCVASTA